MGNLKFTINAVESNVGQMINGDVLGVRPAFIVNKLLPET